MVPKYIQSFLVRVELGVMEMKGFFTFPKASGLEPHHRMQFRVITRTLVVGWYLSAQVQSACLTWRYVRQETTAITDAMTWRLRQSCRKRCQEWDARDQWDCTSCWSRKSVSIAWKFGTLSREWKNEEKNDSGKGLYIMPCFFDSFMQNMTLQFQSFYELKKIIPVQNCTIWNCIRRGPTILYLKEGPVIYNFELQSAELLQ